MDFSWSDEQLEYRQAAVRFARRELSDGVAEDDRRETFPRARWRSCAAFGVLGLPFAERYGGAGADILTTMLVMEGLGYGGRDNGLLFALNAQMWAVQHPIAAIGTEAQQARYLPRLISGELIGAHGITEAESGSDAYAMRARAERCDGGSGRGTFLWLLLDTFPHLPVTAVDANPRRAELLAAVQAGGLERLTGRQADATALPFPDRSFDVVTLLEVLEHIPDAESALAEAVRVCERALLITVPSRPDDNPEHIHLFNEEHLRRMLAACGVSRVKCDGVPGHLTLLAHR